MRETMRRRVRNLAVSLWGAAGESDFFRMGEHFWGRVLALLLLIAAAPVIGVAIVVIRLDSPGSGLFRQERVGRRQEIFVCYKLRTMRTGTRQVATHQVGEAAVTRLGR